MIEKLFSFVCIYNKYLCFILLYLGFRFVALKYSKILLVSITNIFLNKTYKAYQFIVLLFACKNCIICLTRDRFIMSDS